MYCEKTKRHTVVAWGPKFGLTVWAAAAASVGAWPWPARCLLAPLAALTAGLACFQRQPHQTIEVGWASQASGAPIPLLRPGQRQQPAAAAAASGEPAPRGGGRAGAARSSSARRRSFPNSPSPRAPRASRASGASFGTPWPWPRARGRCRRRWGRVGRGRGVQAGGRGGGLLAGGLARVPAHGWC